MMPALSQMMQLAGAAPMVDLETLLGPGGIVVLAPHPDDESLGCGALLSAAAKAGRSAVVVVVTDGRRSHPASRIMDGDKLARLRSQEVRAAVAALHPRIVLIEMGYPDCGVPVSPPASFAAVGGIVAALDRVQATALMSAWGADPHTDHATSAALARQAAAQRPALRHWSYPIWGRFAPTVATALGRIVRFDGRPHRAAKSAAIACHRSQMTHLIEDDPLGFVMPDVMQAHFIDTPEVFLAE